MNPQQREALARLLQAPWSGQVVRPSMRWLAWVVVLLGAFSLAMFGVVTMMDGFSQESLRLFGPGSIGVLYMVLVFGRAAYTGRAPRGWLPWS